MIIMHHGVHYPAVLKLLHQQCLFTQTDLLTVGIALAGLWLIKECLVPVQEVRADSYCPLQKVCPCQGAMSPGQGVTQGCK